MEDTNKPRKCINVVVSPTTGGKFQIEVFNDDTIDELRRKIARHLQMPGEKLKVIFRQRVLSHGTVSDHEIRDGNELRLLPAIESGFSSTVQGTQQSIINAIESLSDDQIDDFLSGRSPLTLALRVGDHMMFVQLQLEQASAAVSSSSASSTQMKNKSFKDHHGRASSSNRGMVGASSASPSSSILDTVYSSMKQQQHKMFKCHHNSLPHAAGSSKTPSANLPSSSSSPPPIVLPNQPNLQRLLNANRMSYGTSSAARSSQQHPSASGVRRATSTATIPTSYTATDDESNKASTSSNKASAFSDLKWNDGRTLLPKTEQRLLNLHHQQQQQQRKMKSSSSSSKQVRQQADGSGGISSSASLRRSATTTSGRITSGVGSLSQSCSGSKIIRQMQRLKRLCSSHQQCVAYSNRELASEISSIVHAAKHSYPDSVQTSSTRSNKKVRLASASAQLHHQQSVNNNNIIGNQQQCAKNSKNTSGTSSSGKSAPATSITGASIDSFITHGPGIFSGTFSGALHPNIQDQQGRPKRDPQTILQILTDLLSATSKYQGSGSGGNELGVIPQVIRDQLIKQNAAAASSSASSKTMQLLSAQLQDAAIRVESRPKTIKQEHHNQQQQSANNKLRRSTSNLYHQPHHPFNCLTTASPQSMVNLHPAYHQVKFSRCHHHHHHHHHHHGNTKMVQNFNNQQRRIKQQQIHQQANLNMITRRKQDENQLTRCKMQHVTAMIRMKRYLRLQRKRNQEMEGQQEWSEPATTPATTTSSEVERTASPTQEIVSPLVDDLQQQQQQTDENEDNSNSKQKSDCHESLTV